VDSILRARGEFLKQRAIEPARRGDSHPLSQVEPFTVGPQLFWCMQSLSIERDELRVLLRLQPCAPRPSSLALSEPHAGASAVLLYEFDASGFQSAAHYFQSCSTGFMQSALELSNGHDANSSSIGKLLLCPV
jgi:hypothetical protein